MKKFLIMLLMMITLSLSSQTVTYQPSTATINNPERGFYYPTAAGFSSYNLLTVSQLQGYKTSGMTIILQQWYLNQYLNAPIPTTYLNNMQTDFNTMRSAGVKCIIRFAYSKTDASGTIYNPNKAQILAHIAQIKPVLQANADVIMCLQLGWLGAWGEWDTTVSSATSEFCNTVGNYTSWNTTCWNNRREVTQAFMDVLPTKYFQIRMPSSKMALYGNTPLSSFGTDYKSRLGHHNDCFVSSPDDYWTYIPNSPIGGIAPQYTYLQQDTKYVPMGGETCALNPPRSDYTTAAQEMAGFHYTYLNSDYNISVLNSWGTNITTAKNNLGYRLALSNSIFPPSVPQGTNIDFTLGIINLGYAAPFNSRPVCILFKNQTTGVIYKKQLNTDIRNWYGTYTVNESIQNDLPLGTYDLYLWLPDSALNLQSNPSYSIQLANNSLWESTTGYNKLNRSIIIGDGVVVPTQPNPPVVVSPINYNQNASSNQLSATGTNLLWYTNATGGLGSTTAPYPSTSVVGATTYYVTQTVNGIESNRAPIVVNVNAVVLAVDIFLYQNYLIQVYNLPSTQSWTIKVYTINGRLKSRSADISGLRAGTYIVYIYQGLNTYSKVIQKL